MQRDQLLEFRWQNVHDMYILSTPHDAYNKAKLLSVILCNKYKIGVNRLEQLLSYYSFQGKSVKGRKLFFCLFDLDLVNAHILH
jgi:hypothetical protein